MGCPRRHRAQTDITNGTYIEGDVAIHDEAENGGVFDRLNAVLDTSNAKLFDRFTHLRCSAELASVTLRYFPRRSHSCPYCPGVGLGRQIFMTMQVHPVQFVPRMQLVDDRPQCAHDIAAQHSCENPHLQPDRYG